MIVSPKLGRWVVWLSPIVIVMALFFASAPWLRDLNDAVTLSISAAAALFLMVYAIVLASRVERGLDEVQRAGGLVAVKHGTTIGWFAAGLVIIFPPALNALASLAKSIAAGSPDKAVILGILFGYMLVIVMQALGMFVACVVWERRVGYR
jgi:hypothetical protein